MEIKIILQYLDGIVSETFHRYLSWDNCNKALNEDKPIDIHALHLGFYLSSWGMYRGSSGLLQKNHLIHEEAIRIILSKEFESLHCTENREISKDSIELIMKLKKELGNYYSKIVFTRGSHEKRISSTDTLLSKILLGTLGCVPAYDRYFVTGLKESGMKYSKFDENSLNEIFDFIEMNKSIINDMQSTLRNKTESHYPVMKIIDMYFWQTGFNKEM